MGLFYGLLLSHLCHMLCKVEQCIAIVGGRKLMLPVAVAKCTLVTLQYGTDTVDCVRVSLSVSLLCRSGDSGGHCGGNPEERNCGRDRPFQ